MLLWRLLKRRLVGIPDVILTVQAKEAIAAVLKGVLLDDDNAENQFYKGSKALRPDHRCAAIFQCISLVIHVFLYIVGTNFYTLSEHTYIHHQSTFLYFIVRCR